MLDELKQKFEGKYVDVVWNMPKGSGLGVFDVLDTKNVRVKRVEEFFDGTFMAYLEDKVYVPVRVERLKLV